MEEVEAGDEMGQSGGLRQWRCWEGKELGTGSWMRKSQGRGLGFSGRSGVGGEGLVWVGTGRDWG